MSKIPVFISCPTTLNKKQNDYRRFLINELDTLNIEPHALGRSDYPKVYPLKEVKHTRQDGIAVRRIKSPVVCSPAS